MPFVPWPESWRVVHTGGGRWQAHTHTHTKCRVFVVLDLVWLEVHPSPFLFKNHDSVNCGQVHFSFEDRSFKLSEHVCFFCAE